MLQSAALRPLFRRMLWVVLALVLALSLNFGLDSNPAIAASSQSALARDKVDTTNYAGQNLQQTEFYSNDFTGVDFSKSDLRGAIFNGVQLHNANLQSVDFRDGLAYVTNFDGADLSDANFTSAMLLQSQLAGAKINGTDFTYAAIDKEQRFKLCQVAAGINSVTGVETRESLECK
jgi:uncharacterized protein YjbI with pentapeptide repeats